jgi:hypothetical protein
MLAQALITFAAEAVEQDEPDKTAFYVLGGILAVYAVAVSFVGIRGYASFPGSKSARSGIMALSVVLVVATLASAVLTS